MKNIIFIFLVLIILAAIGAIFYFWWQNNESMQGNLVPTPSSVTNYQSLPQKETKIPTPNHQKPTDNTVINFPIFNYHHIRPMPPETTDINERSFTVTPEGFEAHLKYFQDNDYQVVLISDLLEYFDTGKPLPTKAVAITFDDARYGQYNWAFPLLKQYGMKATFFITTGWVGRTDILSWEQIKEMSEAGMIIGSHSISHSHLTAQNDADLNHELKDSKKIIEEKIGKIIDLLAYPGGDYDVRVIEFAKATGYSAALGVYKIIEQAPKYRYAIRRFHADDALDSITSKLTNY
jgi:peptidoglycan/xylan/chitin deacetylase (PgdA/CDA1 family)